MKYVKTINKETDLQAFFDVFSYTFLGEIASYDETHKLIYDSSPSFGIPDLRFVCHELASLAELKLDVKFVTCECFSIHCKLTYNTSNNLILKIFCL